jgi:hypothetical protein
MLHKVTVYLGLDDDEDQEERALFEQALSDVFLDPKPRTVERNIDLDDPMPGYTHYMHVSANVNTGLLGYTMDQLSMVASRLETDMEATINLGDSREG